jgi:hypothetical protein
VVLLAGMGRPVARPTPVLIQPPLPRLPAGIRVVSAPGPRTPVG